MVLDIILIGDSYHYPQLIPLFDFKVFDLKNSIERENVVFNCVGGLEFF